MHGLFVVLQARKKSKIAVVDQCPKRADTGEYKLPAMWKVLRPGQRIMGGISGLWELKSLGNKAGLCKLGNKMRKQYGVEVTPPCFVMPSTELALADREEMAKQAKLHPYWVYKPAISFGGKGIEFVTAADVISGDFLSGTIQAYMHKPFLLERSPGLKIKVDVRIFGVQTSVQPMRLFVSEFGYFRTGHPSKGFTMEMDIASDDGKFVHITNVDKERAGLFVNLEYDFVNRGRVPYHPEMEANFSSAGTLEKFWTMIKRQGLNKDTVWENILSLFARVHAGGQPWMVPSCGSAKVGNEGICSQEFIPFYADIGIQEDGSVTMFETHPSCSLKTCVGGDRAITSCFHPIVTEYGSRPGSWGSTVMGLARFIEPEFQIFARRWIDQRLMIDPSIWRCGNASETLLLHGCLSLQAENILVEMAQEDFISCRLGLQDAFRLLKESRQHNEKRGLGTLRNQLTQMLDEVTLKYYETYKELKLKELALHFSNFMCSLGSTADKMYFGHGLDNGCQVGHGWNDNIARHQTR